MSYFMLRCISSCCPPLDETSAHRPCVAFDGRAAAAGSRARLCCRDGFVAPGGGGGGNGEEAADPKRPELLCGQEDDGAKWRLASDWLAKPTCLPGYPF